MKILPFALRLCRTVFCLFLLIVFGAQAPAPDARADWSQLENLSPADLSNAIWEMYSEAGSPESAYAACVHFLPRVPPDRFPVEHSILLSIQGNFLRREGSPKTAIPLHAEARRLRKGRNENLYASACRNLGNCYLDLGRTDSAYVFISQALQAMRRLCAPDSPDLFNYVFDYGCVLQRQGRFGEAKKRFQEALRCSGGDEEALMSVALAFANLHRSQGDEAGACQVLHDFSRENAPALTKTTSDQWTTWRQEAALCKASMGDFSGAVALLDTTLKVLDTLRKATAEMRSDCRQALGNVLIEWGDFETGIRNLRTVLPMLEGLPFRKAKVLHDLAQAYRYQGLPDTARALLRRAMNALPSEAAGTDKDAVLASLHAAFGRCFADERNWKAANTYFENALRHLLRTPGNPQLEVSIQREIGRCLLRQDSFVAAERALQKALKKAEKAQNMPDQVFAALFWLGENCLGQADFEGANSFFERAARFSIVQKKPFEILQTTTALARSAQRFAQITNSKEAWHRCLDMAQMAVSKLDSLKSAFRRDEAEMGLQHIFYQPYHIAAAACLALKQPEKAFAWSQAYKRHFLENLHDRHMSAPDKTLSVAEIDDLRAKLRPGQVLLDFLWGDDWAACFALGRDVFESFEIPKTAKTNSDIEQLFRSCARDPQPLNDSMWRVTSRELTRASVALHQVLFEHLPVWAKNAPEWLLVPDGALWYLPFEVLLESDGGAPGNIAAQAERWLVRRYQFRYMQTAAQILVSENPVGRPRTEFPLLAVAPRFDGKPTGYAELGFNVADARTAHELLGGRLLTGDSATLSAIRAQMPRARIALFSTHGKLDERDPERSALVLALSGENATAHELLTASDLSTMRLGCDLAVLSACEIGRGKPYRGEGFVSLARAFQLAGTSAVLASRWEANDSRMPKLTNPVLENLCAGIRVSEALALARERYFSSETSQSLHPYYWAGLALTGNDPTLPRLWNQRYLYWLKIGLGVLACSVLVLLWLNARLRQRKN